MSANVEILGEKRDKAMSIPLEALQRRGRARRSSYRLKAEPEAASRSSAAREGLAGRSKFIWLSDHWKDYFDVVPVNAGIATLERVEIVAGPDVRRSGGARGPDEEEGREGRREQLAREMRAGARVDDPDHRDPAASPRSTAATAPRSTRCAAST